MGEFKTNSLGEGDKDTRRKILEIAGKIIQERGRPLLLMYYSNKAGQIKAPDVKILESLFEKIITEGRINELDLIIYTRGGDVNTSYRLAQLIRSYTDRLITIIPYYAYSGGTVISLASDWIEMGRSSVISPIDIQVGDEENTLALLNIEKYIEFLKHSCSNIFQMRDEMCISNFAVGLIKELIHTINPLDLGEMFRLQDMSTYYTRILLLDYMLKNNPQRLQVANHIIKKLSSESPSHRFDIDVNIAKGVGIVINDCDPNVYKLSKTLIDYCNIAEIEGKLCAYPERESKIRKPFFYLFGIEKKR